MEREIDLAEISDGKAYQANDMVKVGCKDCAGCSNCCHGMGNSIILDPYDIYQLEKGLQLDFTQLMADKIELNVVDGLIMPNLKMQEETDACAFLNEEGRCSIHSFRTGFCRMFPLGRIYEEGSFHYFLQVHECPYPDKTKIKVKKWLDIPELGRYENYICNWHFFLKDVQKALPELQEEAVKNLNLYLLNQFFVTPYETNKDFYEQFEHRLQEIKNKLN